jgi:hypothetical protein
MKRDYGFVNIFPQINADYSATEKFLVKISPQINADSTPQIHPDLKPLIYSDYKFVKCGAKIFPQIYADYKTADLRGFKAADKLGL